MQSAIQKAKKLMKAKKTQSANAKTRNQVDSLSRTHENYTDTSALELKEFIEIESNMQKTLGLDWYSTAKSTNKKSPFISNRGKINVGVKHSYIGNARSDQSRNKLRESLQERLGVPVHHKKENMTKSELIEYSRHNIHGTTYQDIDRMPADMGAYRKTSFVGIADRPSPLIKAKHDLNRMQPARDNTSNHANRPVKIVSEEKLLPKVTYYMIT